MEPYSSAIPNETCKKGNFVFDLGYNPRGAQQ